ncbi:MAG: glycosyltransferase family 39 protein [Anaerolineae bacterium]|nr:glycosyltransferase family 39 protein [Anaerolineae bacterium]
MSKRTIWIVLILLVAAALRLWLLADVPPGMTHDEADHGLDAWGVVQGIRPIYFSVGYGREPLFDYASALLMASWGPTYLAGRLVAVFSGLILIAATYAWSKVAFNWRVAILTAAGLAVSFWAVMTARHALRSVTMPALFTLAAWFFWRALRKRQRDETAWREFALAGLLLGATMYTYMPARIMWVIFPALLVFWALFERETARRMWQGTLALLALTGMVAAPLLYFLMTTETEQRLDQLSGPLTAAAKGDLAPLWHNTLASLRLFTIEGDSLWRYNLPGRPFLTPVMGVLFYVGLVVALWYIFGRKRRQFRSAAVVALLWLIVGIAPALITGPEAGVTRAIAMQPVLYLFPALAIAEGWSLATGHWALVEQRRWIFPTVVLLLFGWLAVDTGNAYFGEWANAPEVRVQYEATRVAAMRFLNENGSGAVAVSSPRPDKFHDPSTALMTLRNDDVDLRWFNGAYSLLVPGEQRATWLFSGFAELHPALQPYFAGAPATGEVTTVRDDDFDRPLRVYSAETDRLLTTIADQFTPKEAIFGVTSNVALLGYNLLTPVVQPGGVVQFVTLWRALAPLDDVVVFTHVLGDDGIPLAQADRLDVPSAFWHSDDVFIQLHEFALPSSVVPGDYPLAVGAYQRLGPDDLPRLPITINDVPAGDLLPLTTLQVAADE